MKLKLALFMCMAGSVSQQAIGDDLGRLFFTQDQRNALDARRKARIPDKPAAVIIESPVTRVDGFVSRGSGKSTVWVNGEAIPDGSHPEGLKVRPRHSDAGRVTIEIRDSETQVELKIGQSFNRETAEVRDSLQGGEIKINPMPRKK